MLESLFRFLFKYPPLFFEQGDFVLGASRPMMVAIVLAGLAGAYALLSYRSVAKSRGRDRVIFVVLRLAILGVIVFCLLRPELILKAAVPQQNFLGVLVDDSRSLQIADIDGRPRSAFVNDNLGADRPLLNALSKKFVLRFFRFSSTADRLQATSDLKYEGTTTRSAALDRARDELPACRWRARHDQRRRRHVGRGARRVDCEPEGPIDSRVHRRRRPGAVCEGHPGDARRDAARGAQGHLAGRQRRPHADRYAGSTVRSTSKTKAGSSARRR
jgi:hypothetical protein